MWIWWIRIRIRIRNTAAKNGLYPGTVPEQILCLLEERAGKDDDKVGGVPHLRLLHLGAEDHQLGGRVLHLQLSA